MIDSFKKNPWGTGFVILLVILLVVLYLLATEYGDLSPYVQSVSE